MGHLVHITGDAVAAQQLHTLRQLRVIGHGHAALRRGDDLDRVEAEYGDITVTTVADRLTAILATDGMRGILDNLEAILLAERMYAYHVAGLSA
jgi:hypothetical protein